VRITFGGSIKRVPVYIKGVTTAESWGNQLATYNQVPDVELIGDRVFFVYSYQRAVDTKSLDHTKALNEIDKMMNIEDDFSGFDGSAPEHQRVVTRQLVTETNNADPNWMMQATWYRVIVKEDTARFAFTVDGINADYWAMAHEFGHMHQQNCWRWQAGYMLEVTVNLYTLAYERSRPDVTESRLVRDGVYPRAKTFINDQSPTKAYANADFWVKLVMFEQLRLAYGDQFYITLSKQTRSEKPNNPTDEDKIRYFMLKSCKISGNDLTDFFEDWALVPTSSSIYKEIAALNLPQPDNDPSCYPL